MSGFISRLAAGAVAGIMLLSAVPAFAEEAELDDAVIESLTLQPGAETGMLNVTWYAASEDVTNAQVIIDGRVIEAQVSEPTIPTGMSESTNPYAGYSICKATVTGLKSGTEYCYQLTNNGVNMSEEYYYTTPDEDSFIFAFTSDPQINASGTTDDKGWNPSDGTNQTGWDAMVGVIAESGATLIVSAGDQVENQSWGKKDEYDAFFAPVGMSQIAYAPAVGNHDRHYMFDDHFNLPNEMEESADGGDDRTLTEVYTTFRGQNSGTSLSHGNYTQATADEIANSSASNGVSPNEDGMYDYPERRTMETKGNYYYLYNNVLFVTLNTGAYPGGNDEENAGNDSVPSAEAENEAIGIIENFRKTLEAATEDYEGRYDWLIVTHHKSTETVAKHVADSDIENYVDAGFEELMAEYDVDFVLGGHDHVYSRSYVLNGEGERMSARVDNMINPEGVIYLTGNCASDMQYYTPFASLDKTNNEDYPVLANGESGSAAYMEGNLPIGNQEYNQEYSPAFVLFEVEGNTISAKAYNLTGSSVRPDTDAIDSFTVTKTDETEDVISSFESGVSSLTEIARYNSGETDADGGVMEIVTYSAYSQFAYAVNGKDGVLTAISLANIVGSDLKELDSKDFDIKAMIEDEDFEYGDMTSVAANEDGTMIAVAVQAEDYAQNGRAVIFDVAEDGELTLCGIVETGVQPDMITFADGFILTADEGEPREGYDAVDPEGSVTVIDIESLESEIVTFEDVEIGEGVLIKEGSEAKDDLEPEYIAVNGNRAYVTLQEANAVAVLDIENKEFKGVYSLGTVDFGEVKIDLNKNDEKSERGYSPDTYQGVYGYRMPDGIDVYEIDGKTYIVTANEGDSREWGDYTNETSKKLTSDSGVETGKKVTLHAESDGNCLFGTRSFSIFEIADDGIELVFDSGSDFEEKTAQYLPEYFNCSNDSLDVDDRSAKKGPEPESVVLGEVDGVTYAFISLERIGGVMVYDVTNPEKAKFVNYINSRDFSEELGNDDSPEGLCFVAAENSPTGEALLLAACEVGGTVAVYEFDACGAADDEGDGVITIYFTNDVHCGYENYDKVAAIIKDKDLLIDAGDNIQGDLIGTLSDGEYMVDIMNYMGYDAAVPGNHEFDYGMDRFFEIVNDEADFDYISANFRNIETGETLLAPYEIYEAEGEKVAIVGATTPETLVKSNPTYFKDEDGNWIYDFCNDTTGDALYEAIQSAVDDARSEGADYVILVGHLGTDEESQPWTSTEVIANTDGIDALIDGHSHSIFNTTMTNKDGEEIPAIQTGTKLANLGKLTIEDGVIKTENIAITDELEADEDATAFLAEMTSKFEAIQSVVVAESEVDLVIYDPETGDRIIRNQETNLGDLCADAYRAKLGSDIAFVNGGGIRANIAAGDITYGDIVAVHPYGNEACMIEVTGQQIADALEWASRTNPGELGGFLQVSGLTYEIHNYIDSPCIEDEAGGYAGMGDGERRVKNIKIGGKAIDYDATYTLGGHNYMLLDFGDGFNMFEGSEKLLEAVAIDNQVLIDYITGDLGGVVKASSIYKNAYGEGRIKIYTSKPKKSSGGSGGSTVIVTNKTESETSATSYTDVATGDWYYEAVSYVTGKSLMSAKAGAEFKPNDKTTRGEIAMGIYKAEGSPSVSGNAVFTDVSTSSAYFAAVKWCVDNKIFTGYGDGTFGANDSVTREQLAAIMYRYAEYKKADLTATKELGAFKDAESVMEYAKTAVKWCVASGIIEGDETGKLNPQGSATRAEAAAMLMRFEKSIEK